MGRTDFWWAVYIGMIGGAFLGVLALSANVPASVSAACCVVLGAIWGAVGKPSSMTPQEDQP